MTSDKEICLAVDQWLDEEKEDGDTWRELAIPRSKKEPLPLLDYEVHTYTGSKQGAETDSNVYINLFGTRGDSGKRKLQRSKNHTAKFQQGQVDVFCIQAVSLGDLKKVLIGHDGTGPGNGWFLDNVTIKFQENYNEHKILFPCNSWLDEYQGDGKTERELLMKENDSPQTSIKELDESLKSTREGGQWKICIKTARDSPDPEESKVTVVIYGSKGKTGDLLLSPPKADSLCFIPGTTDEFLINTADVGDVYKVRVSCDNIPAFRGWHLKSLHMKEEETGQEITCSCNCWFSSGQEDGEMVQEFPAAIKGKPRLPVNKYIVSIHIGDHWGSETFANVYLTLYGEKGDTGARKLEQPLIRGQLFQRNKTDSFIVKAVSLSQLHKIVVGHDGEGYGSGMYLKMITVRDSQNADDEWVFPFWNWLDSHLGTCQTVGKLTTIGRRLVANPELSRLNMQSSGLWVMDIVGSDLEAEMGPVHLSIILFGDLGQKKRPLEMTGNAAQIKDELEDVGVIYKVQLQSDLNSQLKQQWQLSYIHLRHTGTHQEMWLNFNCWFKPNEETCVELPALYAEQDPLPVVDYTIHVYTGDAKNAEARGEAYVSIQGERGSSGKRWLNNVGTGPITFDRGQVDVFRLKAVHLGKLHKLTIGFNSSKNDNWLLEKIIVKEEGCLPSVQHIFVHNDWIGKQSKKDFTEVVIPITEENVTSEIIKNLEAVSKGHWYMWLQSSVPEKVPNMQVIVFGKNGKTLPQKVMNLENDPFLVHVDDIGEITKVSFIQLDTHLKRGIQLHKLRLKDLDSKEELGFHTAEQWLFEEDGSETVTELAAVHPGKAPLNDLLYSVSVYTGTLPASETDADVFLTIFGENGDSCKRKLKHSISPGVFEKGQVNIFSVKAVDLGMLSKVIVEHNAAGYGAGWYLDHITIQESRMMDCKYWFPCQQWLDSAINDKQIERELKLLGRVNARSKELRTSMHGTWDVLIVTSDFPGSSNDAEMTLTVCCENGCPGPVIFPRGCLKQGQVYQTTLELDEKCGAIQKVRLQTQDIKNGGGWHCHEVKLQHKQSKDMLEFPFLRNFSQSEGCTVAELPVLIPGSEMLTVKEYILFVTTGKSSKPGTAADIYVTLRGLIGDTGRRKLNQQGKNSFSSGKVDIFRVEAVDIGQLQELFVEKGKGSDWQLEQIAVKEGEFAEKKTIFLSQPWQKSRRTKTASATLHVKEIQESGNGETCPPGGELMESDGEWNIYLTKEHKSATEQSSDSAEDISNLVMVLYGTKGKSSPTVIEISKQYKAQDRINYKVHLPSDLGELLKVRFGLESLQENTSPLFLRHFKMQNTATLNTFSHSINKTLPLSFNGDRWIEVPVEWPLKASLSDVTYHVTIVSNAFVNMSNISHVFVCMYGANGDTGVRHLSRHWQDVQRANSKESFAVTLDAVELGELQRIGISCRNQNDYKLYIKNIEVKESLKPLLWIFKVNEEFSDDANEDERTREFPVSHTISEGAVQLNDDSTYTTPGKHKPKTDVAEHLIKVYTADVMGAGTDAKVHIVLNGERGSSGPILLTKPLEHKNPFEKGKVDTFKVTTKSLGRILNIEIGHDGRGYGSGWFLEKVEISDVSTNEMYSFSCNRWLAEDENDGRTVVQLHA